MGKIIDSFYQPMTIIGNNIDPRYFSSNNDGKYVLTPLMIYSIARDAAKYFKNRIFEIDTEYLYHSSSIREVNDEFSHNLQYLEWQIKYEDKLKEANRRWYKYRDEHPDEFELGVKRIATGGEAENRFLANYKAFITPNLVSTVQAYNAARQLLKRFDSEKGQEYKLLPFEQPIYSREKFAAMHKGVKAKIYSELDIPNEHLEIVKVEKVINRISNKKCDEIDIDDSELEGFAKGLINHVTTHTAKEYSLVNID